MISPWLKDYPPPTRIDLSPPQSSRGTVSCAATLQETLRTHPLQLTGKIIMDMPPAALAQGLDLERIGSVMKLLISLVFDGKKAKTRVLRPKP